MSPKDWKTRLIHPDAHAPENFRSLNVPVHRASTFVFDTVSQATDAWDQYEAGYTYGTSGTPTVLELAVRVCELEGGYRTILAPGGLAAISLIQLSLLKSGDHVLLPESVYAPSRRFAYVVLRRLGIEVSTYPPLAGAEIASHFRPNTRLVWCESPGSITMEVQDVPAIAEAAHRAGALVVLDNTWSAGVLFDAFAHGVDVTMQALTKYIGGHSDLLLGSVTVRDPELYKQIGLTQHLLGNVVSPDDCSLALRGLKTLAVRLEAIERSALSIAQWLAARPEIELVLHPALPACPGHDLWQRDFHGSSGLFSIVFKPEFTGEQVRKFVDSLKLFKIGYSWAGVTSLAMWYEFRAGNRRPDYTSRIVRLNIGLESTDDLKADLEQGLEGISPR
jgi:cystathionine beta-lyase